ncbi:hypothetical protein IV203_035209 [Nitzschia inconspicua]|uniref:Uncharacterized protein n=1 Tax=Nitzschia inconspicua TaxID=303405 RepID=A0A9K3LCX6_9STRA|nr:hypothetical protein IV203_035209 [Nitzschia inconspicua]
MEVQDILIPFASNAKDAPTVTALLQNPDMDTSPIVKTLEGATTNAKDHPLARYAIKRGHPIQLFPPYLAVVHTAFSTPSPVILPRRPFLSRPTLDRHSIWSDTICNYLLCCRYPCPAVLPTEFYPRQEQGTQSLCPAIDGVLKELKHRKAIFDASTMPQF